MIINTTTIEQLSQFDLDQLNSKELIRTFNQNTDSIELTISDPNGSVIISDEKFTDYTPYLNGNGQITSVDIDFEQVLRSYGRSNGQFNLNFSFQRKILTDGFKKPFVISEISPSRTEIRFKSYTISNKDFITACNNLISLIQITPYFKDINLSFGNGSTPLIVNAQLDKNTCLLKLYNPLPPSI